MLSINDGLFQNWWSELVDDPEDIELHLNKLQMMIDEEGLDINEENIDGLTICDFIICELHDFISETHRVNFEQVLLWICDRLTPTVELIKSFHYNKYIHILEEILKRYEGPLIDFNGMTLKIEFLEVIIGFDNVVDIIKMEKFYRKAIENKLEWIVIEY